MGKLSVILPAYNEEKMISVAYERIHSLLSSHGIPFEIVFVDDGSVDHTWEEILKCPKEEVVGIHFSRNFGKDSAIFAGLENATGDCVAVMDCDMQHPPETLLEMYQLWQDGYEMIDGVKLSRGKENPLHTACSQFFYHIMSKTMGLDMSNASDFKLMDRKVVEAICSMKEQKPFFRAVSAWVGFKKTTVGYYVQERMAGESKWKLRSLIRYAISNITSFSTVPMQLVTVAGIITFLITVALGINTLINYFSGNALEGFTTVILLILIIGSVLMFSLGIIGFYIARIYQEIKGRPKYIISQKLG